MQMPGEAHTVHLNVNGIDHTLELEARVSLLDALRERLHLFGTKKGCNQGACGACTVLVDGERINACFALAIQYEGRRVVTVEGLATTEGLHPLQKAFIQHDGFQCGYCTPGQICSAVAMISEFESGLPSAVTASMTDGFAAGVLTDAEIKERMSGNLCRCGAYVGITDAIQQVYREANSRQTNSTQQAEAQGVSQ